MGDRNLRVDTDNTKIIFLKGWVSGTDSGAGVPRNMTGSLIEGTELNAYISYPSGTVASLNNAVLPSGSVLITLPGGGGAGTTAGAPNNRFARTLYFDVTMETSGTDKKMNALATAMNYRVVPIAHSSVSGTYAFAFQRLSGSANAASGFTMDSDPTFTSASFAYEVPQDLVNPGSPVCEWSVMIAGRTTNRRV